MATDESIYRATATSGGAVVFAGCTVMIALLSLAIVGIPLVTTLGYTSALVVAVAVLGAITLLPCVLALLGDRIDRGRIPLPHRKEDDGRSHGWHRWGEFVSRHPLPAALVATVILVALAVPVLGLYLGQQDNGALAKSTEARKAYDGMTTAFGAGSNGPLLVSVDLSKKPAKADQSNIDKVNKTEKDDKDKAQTKADDKEQQVTEQLEASGAPAGRGAAAGRVRGPARPEEAARPDHAEVGLAAQEGAEPRDGPAPAGPARRHQEDAGRQERHRAARQQGRHRRGDHRDADDRAVGRGDLGPRDHPPRRRHPEGDERQGHDRVGRRHDRELRRPRGRDREPARADDPDRHRAQLRAADARLPVARDPAHRRPDEPGLDRRRLRRGQPRVRGRRRRRPHRPARRGADRLLRPAADVRDPLRALDGLRGVPDDAHQGGLGADEGQHAPRSSRASARPGA